MFSRNQLDINFRYKLHADFIQVSSLTTNQQKQEMIQLELCLVKPYSPAPTIHEPQPTLPIHHGPI